MSKQYAFSSENKGAVDTALEFPRMKLKKGEVARVAIFGIATDDAGKRSLVVPSPEGGYFFDLNNPSAEKDYIGSFECLASEEVKAEDDLDPEACPHCEIAARANVSEDIMGKRKRKSVLPVIRYKTKPRSAELITPYSVEALAWRIRLGYFNQLVDENERWADPEGSNNGLLKHDLSLTCEVEAWQNYNIAVMPEAAYTTDKDLQRLVLETYISQTADLKNGLIRQLGQTLNYPDLERKIRETIDAATLTGGDFPVPAAPAVDDATVRALAEDLLGSDDDAPEADGTPIEDAADAVVDVAIVDGDSAPSSGDPIDFDSFFDK